MNLRAEGKAQGAVFFQLQFSLKQSHLGHVGLLEGQQWTWRGESGSSPFAKQPAHRERCSSTKHSLRRKRTVISEPLRLITCITFQHAGCDCPPF